MGFVIDASVAACWLLPDESHPVATIALDRMLSDVAIAPSIWWFEIRSLLVVNQRRGRLSSDLMTAGLATLAKLPIIIEPLPEDEAVTAMAIRHKLTIYDASYMELAKRKHLPLASLDKELISAAMKEGVPLLG